MADNKFGLSDALINAVRQVAENSAPLPRDERERDLERQARSNPKKLDEALIGKQKKLDKNKNGKLDKDDFEMLRKEEGVYTPPGYDESPYKGYDPRSMSSYAKKKKTPLPTDVAPKMKTPSVKEESEIEEATKKLTARERFIKGLKRGGYDVEASHAAAVKADKELKQKNSETMSKYAKEETELDEALTPAQRKALQKRREAMRGTKAAPKPKVKAKAYVSPEKDEKDENENSSGEKETHIVMAARKAVSLGEYPFTFENGKTHIIDKSTGRKIIAVHGNQKDKSEFEARLRTSHEGMKDALKNPDNAPVKRDTKAERLSPKPLRPDFMQRLDQMAAAHAARQKKK